MFDARTYANSFTKFSITPWWQISAERDFVVYALAGACHLSLAGTTFCNLAGTHNYWSLGEVGAGAKIPAIEGVLIGYLPHRFFGFRPVGTFITNPTMLCAHIVAVFARKFKVIDPFCNIIHS